MRSAPAPGARRVSRDRWMVSYADMITLLFACFAALYASSLVPPRAAPAEAIAPDMGAGTDRDARRFALRAEIETAVNRAGSSSGVKVIADARGVVVSLPEAGAFGSGQADLSQAARQVLRQLAAVLQKETGEIRVEGHTDNVPVSTSRYASNWELSAARATEVIRFLIAQGGIAPDRLAAAGYGEFRPVASNDTPGSRARNRRVDIFVLR